MVALGRNALVLWIGVLYPPLHHSVVPHAVAMTFGGTLVGLAHIANLKLNLPRATHLANNKILIAGLAESFGGVVLLGMAVLMVVRA